MMRRCSPLRAPSAATRHASYLLGIETSCDDTAAAVLDQDGRVLSSVISSQWELNAKWKGIVPALAARAHADNLPHVINAAIEQSGLESVRQLSAVAVTSGPGLAPCLDVGLRTARQICLDNPDIAFLQINHLEARCRFEDGMVCLFVGLELIKLFYFVNGRPTSSCRDYRKYVAAHALAAVIRLILSEFVLCFCCHRQLETPRPEFPFVVLLVSGGHCCLVLAKGIGDYELLGNTLDDSIGEAYDKVARMLGITAAGGKGVHGGKLIEDMAARGNDRAFPFTEPMKHRKDCDFSYSGIKTAMLREVKKLDQLDEKIKEDLCASFQRKAVDQLITRTRRACQWGKDRMGDNISSLVVCGGVASNQYLRGRMQAAAKEDGMVAIFPPAKYCTDNGVMVAWAGLERYAKGMRSDPESARYQPRWPLETLQPL
ncbi:putative tRNA N6-adenosine threonylcarbamoyltransferase, mitochondrial [Phytophthora pseudosyringae]|uniref:Putative tRNA N6-adenosine threonylcarbamoyltransferase, mitochondrial n=1 Tax=Phytophthora pseudosyringae TaxID=221518 RepID=A0A8T1WDB0_9STRA|nr:putative tRNA N6-adenosine threonylcarbamoyltransferase, mitochondrial [Phytophthora pseudosyringae]